VAAITVFVRYGVTDLALKVTQVLLVLGITLSIGPDFLVAVFALDYIRVLIPGSCGLARTVEFLAVALGAGHGGLSPVDISRQTFVFPEVFGADAGTVACSTIVLHGRSLAELVSGNKTAVQLIRSADVTLPAGGVTLLAVIFKGRGQRGTLFQVASPGFKDRFKTAKRCVKADIVCVGDVLVAGIAITLGRVGYQPHVS